MGESWVWEEEERGGRAEGRRWVVGGGWWCGWRAAWEGRVSGAEPGRVWRGVAESRGGGCAAGWGILAVLSGGLAWRREG